MDKRFAALGLIVLVCGLVFLGLTASSQATALSLSAFSWKASNLLLRGKLDVTVTIVNIAYTINLKDVNGGADLSGKQVPIGTQINVVGTLIGSDSQPITGYPAVALNIMPEGGTPEDGNQCWIGSTTTDSQGAFGVDGYLEVRADGWYSSYSGIGGDYVQNKNGAGNQGCAAWATDNPVGKSFTIYAAISTTSFSDTKTFSVAQGNVGCSIAGTVKIKGSNEVQVYNSQYIRMPSSTTWTFTPSSGGDAISTVSVSSSGSGASQVFSLTKGSTGDWTGTVTLATGTYTVALIAKCAGGASKSIATLSVTVREGPVEIINTFQDMYTTLEWSGGILAALGVVVVVYGITRKP